MGGFVGVEELKNGLKNAYGYVRVSTEEQVEEGISLRVQRARIAAFAKAYGLKLVKIYGDEGVSGRTLQRPQIQELLERVRGTEGETIIVYKLSRLSRSTRDLLMLVEEVFQKGNTRLISMTEHIDTETPMGRFFLTIMGGLAQMERELIAERTKETLEWKKEHGEALGAAPFGYRWSKTGKLVQDPKEIEIARRILVWRKEGKSFQAIADALNRAKVKPERGKLWYASTVRYMTENPRYEKR